MDRMLVTRLPSRTPGAPNAGWRCCLHPALQAGGGLRRLRGPRRRANPARQPMRRSRRARRVRRPPPKSPTPRRVKPPTAAPVRGRELGRSSVWPSTSVPGAVVEVVAFTPAVSSPALTAAPSLPVVPAVDPAALVPAPVAATVRWAPVPVACADAVHWLASFGSTWQSVRSTGLTATFVGVTVTVVRAVVVVVVVDVVVVLGA